MEADVPHEVDMTGLAMIESRPSGLTWPIRAKLATRSRVDESSMKFGPAGWMLAIVLITCDTASESLIGRLVLHSQRGRGELRRSSFTDEGLDNREVRRPCLPTCEDGLTYPGFSTRTGGGRRWSWSTDSRSNPRAGLPTRPTCRDSLTSRSPRFSSTMEHRFTSGSMREAR